MTRELLQQALDALEPAQVAKLSDGTYLDKDCKITMAIAALRAALAEPQGWRPIETAPKDGYFLVHEDGAIRVKLRHKGVLGKSHIRH